MCSREARGRELDREECAFPGKKKMDLGSKGAGVILVTWQSHFYC